MSFSAVGWSEPDVDTLTFEVFSVVVCEFTLLVVVFTLETSVVLAMISASSWSSVSWSFWVVLDSDWLFPVCRSQVRSTTPDIDPISWLFCPVVEVSFENRLLIALIVVVGRETIPSKIPLAPAGLISQ